MKKRNCSICDAKAKVLISCAVTAQPICAFVFALAIIRFSYDLAQLIEMLMSLIEMYMILSHACHVLKIYM